MHTTDTDVFKGHLADVITADHDLFLLAQVYYVSWKFSLAALNCHWLKLSIRCLCLHIVKKWEVFAFEGKTQRQLLLAQFATDFTVWVNLQTFFLSFFKPSCDPVFETLKVGVLNWTCAFAKTDQRIIFYSFWLETNATVWACVFLWMRALDLCILSSLRLLLAGLLRCSLLLIADNSLELHLKFSNLN